MSQDTDISATALAIALVALVIAIGQILQQYWSTADGARRCQPSVIGLWARETNWHFRWSELRYEVLFKTPHIVFPDGSEKGDLSLLSVLRLPSQGKSPIPIIGRFIPKRSTGPFFNYLVKKSAEEDVEETVKKGYGTDQLVCWVPLLEELFNLEQDYADRTKRVSPMTLSHEAHSDDAAIHFEKRSVVQKLWRPQRARLRAIRSMRSSKQAAPSKALDEHAPRYPALEIRERSWDLVPPDVVRPYASSNLGDTLVMCHRLGMTLRAIDLSQGTFYAEGQGYSLSASQIRGFGMLAYFTRDKAYSSRDNTVVDEKSPRQLWTPSPTADSFAFGICPCDEGLGIPDLDMSTEPKIFELLRQWDHTEGKRHVQQHRKEVERRGVAGRMLYGFTFVFGTMAPYVPASGVTVFRTPYPQPHLWHQWSSPEEWHTFKNRLGDFLEAAEAKDAHYAQLRKIKEQLGRGDWHEAANDSGIKSDSELLCDGICARKGMVHLSGSERRERFRKIHVDTRTYIQEFNQMELHNGNTGLSSNFYELLKSYVCVSIHRREQAEQRIKDQGHPTNTYGMKWVLSNLLTEMGHLNWDKLDDLVEDMRTKGFGKDKDGNNVEIRKPIIEAWATMFVRWLMFQRTVQLQGQGTLRPEFRKSKIPVYIG